MAHYVFIGIYVLTVILFLIAENSDDIALAFPSALLSFGIFTINSIVYAIWIKQWLALFILAVLIFISYRENVKECKALEEFYDG